jgi:ligand-binding sensor domain-containing protein
MQAQLSEETETEPLTVMDISAHSAWHTGSEWRKYIIAVVKAAIRKVAG